ncbi:MAG: PQQ-dependent sugar dehydrogenase [Acidobacteriota bacterium]|nr:PQQ-dependent sugar dehydrogenase [Acidobacteriota bacterium]
MKKVVICSSLFFSFIILIFAAANVQGQSTPTIRLQPVLSDLFSPVFSTSARDGSRRLFVVELGGTIKVAQPGAATATDFLNISSKISTGGERGLLGLAFHPQFSQNRRFFVYYTRVGDGALQIGEFQASAGNPNVADTTEKVIISIPHSTNNNHNGGTIAFGADGYLYLAPGDGGGANDAPNNAQNINQLLGKVLRIDINTPANSTTPYLIPPDNPFAGATPGADEIYAFGMRNPYRFSFDRGGTNQLWVGDVGQNSIEEVDIIVKGGNYGWRIMEGSQCTPTINSNCTPPSGHIPPVFEYSSAGQGGRCSVTGGNVYRGTRGTVQSGAYIYGDYCSGEIFLWNNNQQTLLLDTDRFISSFGEDEDGEIYVTGLLSGTVERIERVGAAPAKAPFDFDGDGKTDLSIFRPSNGEWWYLRSSDGGNRTFQFGNSSDQIVPADYTGDGKTDIAFWRFSTGEWFILRSEDNSFYSFPFGTNGDRPAPADYDGDGKADPAVFRSSNQTWYILRSSGGTTIQQFGQGGDVPVVADYDGDNKADLAIYRSSQGQWWILRSTAGIIVYQFGRPNEPDYPVQGDYTGDGRADVAFYRDGEWFVLRSENNSYYSFPFGAHPDRPSPGDYDGDGKTDAAVFRGGQNPLWYVQRSSSGTLIQGFGIFGDRPVPNAYVPILAIP